jgi:Polyprenyl synthetase
MTISPKPCKKNDDSHDYPNWSLRVFETYIFPLIKSLNGFEDLRFPWVDSCSPGAKGRQRYRLYPGSFYLLWLQAYECVPNSDHYRVAAAIELLHNASLLHDDVIDEHDCRAGERTIRGIFGNGLSLLAGDLATGHAFQLLSSVPAKLQTIALASLSHAFICMTEGQVLDEAQTWRNVPAAKQLDHWMKVARAKLSLGNVPGVIAGRAADRSEQEVAKLHDLHMEFAVISQIINDLGDFQGLGGYHTLRPSKRPKAAEASIKPNLFSFWPEPVGNRNADCLLTRENKEAAVAWIDLETEKAQKRLAALNLRGEPIAVLVDFFTRPAQSLRETLGL